MMTEAELLECVRQYCKLRGLYLYHPHDSRKSQPGFPDCWILNLRDGRVMYRELKNASYQLTADQKRVLYALRAGGHDAGVWRPKHWHAGVVRAELDALAGVREKVTA